MHFIRWHSKNNSVIKGSQTLISESNNDLAPYPKNGLLKLFKFVVIIINTLGGTCSLNLLFNNAC